MSLKFVPEDLINKWGTRIIISGRYALLLHNMIKHIYGTVLVVYDIYNIGMPSSYYVGIKEIDLNWVFKCLCPRIRILRHWGCPSQG